MPLFRSLFIGLFFLISCSQVLVQAQSLVSKSHVGSSAKWQTYKIDKEEYVKLSDLCQFYKFGKLKKPLRSGFVTYGANNRYISLRAGSKDFYVNHYRYILSFPVRESAGDLMVSVTDIRKLIDPVLRPQFSADGKVTTVVIDPGHGGHDAGAVSSYAMEKTCNLALAQKLAQKLERKGLKVVMTRTGDYFLTLQQRVDVANKYPQSIFVSIHHNSASNSSAKGMETFTLAPQGTTSPYARSRVNQTLSGNSQDSENIALATAIHSRCIKASGALDRGIQRARFSVLCTIKRPAVLFEAGFVNNPQEGPLVNSDAYQHKLAEAMCEGIVAYCAIVGNNKSLKSTSTTPRGGTSGTSGATRSSLNSNNQYKGTTRLR